MGIYANTTRNAMPAPANINTGSATARAQTTRRTFYVAPKSVPPFLCGLQESNGAIVAFTAACLVLIGRIRFSRGRFASVRPVVIGLAGSQSPVDLSNSQSSRLSAASVPSVRSPCYRGIGLASYRSLFKCGEKVAFRLKTGLLCNFGDLHAGLLQQFLNLPEPLVQDEIR